MNIKGRFLLTVIAALAAFPTLSAETVDCSSTSGSADIVGVWRLLEASTTLADGTVQHPYGKPAAGLFVYTPGGYLSLHLHRNPPRAKFSRPPTDSELGAVAREYIGYYGTWSMTGNTVNHHIEGAMSPDRIGQDAERPFALCGDVLELNIEGNDGRRFYRRLQRIETFADPA